MPTQCNTKPLEFESHQRRRVVAAFEGSPITSDASALLLRRVGRHLSLFDQVADCFTDHRDPKRIHNSLRTLIAQRIVGLALGYEDLNHHDQLRHDLLRREQQDRFFHGYYKGYCFLPLYIFSDRHLICALLRPANIDASADALNQVQRIVTRLRGVWRQVKILLRADSGFTREELMA